MDDHVKIIQDYISKARIAQKEINNYTQEQIDLVCVAIGWEVYNDEKGVVWPEEVAPYKAHLIKISNLQSPISNELEKFSNGIYHKLQDSGTEVLYDDRKNVTTGQKFADCDLIGIPYRLVVSEKAGDKIEVKKRNESKTELLGLDSLIDKLKS